LGDPSSVLDICGAMKEGEASPESARLIVLHPCGRLRSGVVTQCQDTRA
jgi:hypothetical protein